MPRRRRSALPGWFFSVILPAAIAILGIGGIVAGLNYLGYFGLRQRVVSRQGLVPVPRTVRAVKAYNKIRREDIVDMQQGDESYLWISQEALVKNPGWVRDTGDIIGRVLARDKAPGYIFQEKDFLPEGTREGIVAGIPVGKRAMVVQADQIHGMELLSRGDSFDLFATLPVKGNDGVIPEISLLASEVDTLTGGTRTPESRAASIQSRLGVKLLVRGAVIVDVSEKPAGASGARAPKSQLATKDITIAVLPEEVISLTHAMSLKYSVFCAAISGRPGEKLDSEADHPILKGMVPIPVRSTTIPSLTQVSREHLLDSATGQLSVLYFKPEDIDVKWLTKVEDLLNRVTITDLGPGLPFRHDELQPLGTRPGISGGTPAGRVAMKIERAAINGPTELKPGDHLTLVAAVPVDLQKQFPQIRLGAGVPHAGQDQLFSELKNQSHIRVLVQDGYVVSNSAGDTSVSLAVFPAEIPELTKALAGSSKIYTIVRSGHMEGDTHASKIVSPPHPYEGVSVVETISGQRRTLEVFATAPPTKANTVDRDAPSP